MRIMEKIDEIRSQPETVRLRYIWICVSFSMFFIISLWLISLQSTFRDPKTNLIPPPNTLSSPSTNNQTALPSLEQLIQKDPSGLGKPTEAQPSEANPTGALSPKK